jgi:hypothetical protein
MRSRQTGFSHRPIVVRFPMDGSGKEPDMVLAFGGILFFLVAIVVVGIVAWAVIGYLRGTAEAAEEGIDPGPDDHPDAGHVAGPQDRP